MMAYVSNELLESCLNVNLLQSCLRDGGLRDKPATEYKTSCPNLRCLHTLPTEYVHEAGATTVNGGSKAK